MGVQGLWPLLEPIGRRINVEALSNKKLAVDASIWLHQFVKAMRDERGEVVKHAHLLGFFRRICRLLFHRIHPVFVFDGATPALKRRTIIARRRRQEVQNAKLRKTAEKLLMNQLKVAALTQVIDKEKQAEEQRNGAGPSTSAKTGKKSDVAVACAASKDSDGESADSAGPFSVSDGSQNGDRGARDSRAGKLPGGFLIEEDTTGAVEEQAKWAEGPSTSMGDRHLKQATGPSTPGEKPGASGAGDENGDDGIDDKGHELDDEFEDMDDDMEDDEVIVPDDVVDIDPEVLCTLPPSVQYDVLLKLRDRQFGENRERLASLSEQPEEFSLHQMNTYLKSTEMRRKIEGIRSDIGRVVGKDGLQVQKIASEENREFVLQTNVPEPSPAVGPNSTKPGLGHPGSGQPPVGGTLSEMLQNNRPVDKTRQTEDEAGGDMGGSVPIQSVNIEFELPVPAHSEDEGLEWEDVGAQQEVDVPKASGDKDQLHRSQQPPSSWRERAAQRQKYWSLSHGFRFGRKLAQWGQHDAGEGDGVDQDQSDDGIQPHNLEEEDEQLQEAIRQSLQETSHPAPTHSQSDWPLTVEALEREDGPQPELYAPSTSTQVHQDPMAMNASRKQDSSSTPSSQGRSEGKRGTQANETASVDMEIEWSDVEIANVCEKHQTGGRVSPVAPVTVSGRLGEPGRDTAAPSKRGHSASTLLKMHNQDAVALRNSMGEEHMTTASPKRQRRQSDSGGEVSRRDATANSLSGQMVEGENKGGDVLDAPGVAVGDVVTIDFEDGGSEAECLDLVEQGVESSRSIDGALLREPDQGCAEDRELVDMMQSAQAQKARDDGRTNSTEPQAAALLGSREDAPRAAADVQIQHSLQSVGLGDIDMDDMATGGDLGEEWQGLQRTDEVDVEEQLLELASEGNALRQKRSLLARHAEAPTAQMYGECQELLQMFGLPYIIAPMEAEAQCAFLDSEGLVDGVVTDDNDVFLFGGSRIYRNLFENKKYVEEYCAADVQTELGLDRGKLMRIALLLGSDYTEGISGIGIVNAMEVVNAFPGDDGLQDFKKWLQSPDEELVAAAQARVGPADGVDLSGPATSGMPRPEVIEFMNKHKVVRKNWVLPESFPSAAVLQAYTSPQVDRSKDKFVFGRPDLEILRSFCQDRFGWDKAKVDELLVPVLRAHDQRTAQLRIDSFLQFRQRFAKIKSRRLQKAVTGVAGGGHNPDIALPPQADSRPRGRKGGKGKSEKSERRRSEAGGDGTQDADADAEQASKRQRGPNKSGAPLEGGANMGAVSRGGRGARGRRGGGDATRRGRKSHKCAESEETGKSDGGEKSEGRGQNDGRSVGDAEGSISAEKRNLRPREGTKSYQGMDGDPETDD